MTKAFHILSIMHLRTQPKSKLRKAYSRTRAPQKIAFDKIKKYTHNSLKNNRAELRKRAFEATRH